MLGPDLLGRQGLLLSALGHTHPLCRAWVPSSTSPVLSLQILQGLVDVRIPHNEFYRKRKCTVAASSLGFPAGSLRCGGQLFPAPVSPACGWAPASLCCLAEGGRGQCH